MKLHTMPLLILHYLLLVILLVCPGVVPQAAAEGPIVVFHLGHGIVDTKRGNTTATSISTITDDKDDDDGDEDGLSDADGENGLHNNTLTIQIHEEWAPLGAARFTELVRSKFFTNAAFFRVIPGFVAQFGLPASPQGNEDYDAILDDEVKEGNREGTLAFAMTSSPHSRTTQLYFNLENNDELDARGFAVIGEVVGEGDLSRLRALYDRYEGSPDQTEIKREGNEYLYKNFPNLSFIRRAEIVIDSISSP